MKKPIESVPAYGEVIRLTVRDGKQRLICWINISKSTRVKTSLPLKLFDGLPQYPGAEFEWHPATNTVSAREFDNAELLEEFDQLEKEWDKDLKHRQPRMAE